MPTLTFQTQTDHTFFTKLYESVKRIFSTQRQEWTCEQILRFLALIKVQTKLQTFFYEFKITGELLFDIKYLWSQIKNYLDEKTYFPIMKLLYVVQKINILDNKPAEKIQFLKASSNSIQNNQIFKNGQKQELSKQLTDKSPTPKKKCSKTQSSQTVKIQKPSQRQIPDLEEPECQIFENHQNYLNVQGQILQCLEKQFKKLGQSLIADLSSNQLARIFKSTENQKAVELSELIKIYSIDGYCIVCLLADRDLYLEEIRAFFSNEQITHFQQILNLILPFYYKQMFQMEERQANKAANSELNGFNINFYSQKSNPNLSQYPSTSSNLRQSFGTSQMGTSQMGTSQMGTSQIYGQSQAGSGDGNVEFGTSQYDKGQSHVRQSMGRSEYGRSEMGNSVSYARSEYDSSEYGVSERGSLRQSMGQSVIGGSFVFKQPKQKVKDVRASSVEDTTIIQRLQQVSLRLPFNLFKMDPLQNIKIISLIYPFTINFDKPKTHEEFVRNVKQSAQKMKQCASSTGSICEKDFNITGAKFGRSQQNDYRYPDELSISSKHAQIGFWNDKYQLVDFQSKTGTFLYIPMTRPLILKDEQIIQLSNEIQIIVHILKKQATEGTIKLEFTKPENEPFYKATLKENQTLKIGRSQKSHIKLSQQSISSKHTEIKYENKEFKIYDCLSPAGTWLRLSKKGVKSQMFPLQEGDIIRISSKKTYLIKEIRNCLGQDLEDEEFEEMSAFLSNPDYKILRDNNDDNFNQIVQKAMKRKAPHQKKLQVHFEDQFTQFHQ